MNSGRAPQERAPAPPGAEELFIYHIEGRLRPDAPPAGEGFLGNWEEGDSSFLFFSRANPEALARLLLRQPHLALRDHYRMPYAQWQEHTPVPLRAGPFEIHPAGACAPVDGSRLRLRLDPGLVFGAGSHPTTRTCLEAMGALPRPAPGAAAMDLGCGSGLLALAAAALGYGPVLALDLNGLAVRTARGNILRNRMQRQVLAVQGRAEAFFHRPAELVTANLHWEVLERLLDARLLANKGWLVLSGLLRGAVGRAAELLERQGARVLDRICPDGIWHTLVARGGEAARRPPRPRAAHLSG
jgi:ribosomal protein L11 methyltransferase